MSVYHILTLALLALTTLASTSNVKAIYIFGNVTKADTTPIKTSGFNTIIIFALNLKSNGDLVYPAIVAGDTETPLVTNGVYVGGAAYSNLVKGYKTGNTTIKRTEATISGATAIQSLINSQGTGPSTALYKTMSALKAAWNLDAINNDDESLYDVNSTVAFAQMLGQIGYKYTTAPYTYQSFWAQVASELNEKAPGLQDTQFVQCYDGGSGNDPGQWQQAVGVRTIPLLWVTNKSKPYDGSTPQEMQTQFSGWKSSEGITGGGLWNSYDIQQANNNNFAEYANVLNTVFG